MKTQYTLIVCIMLLLTIIPATANIPNTEPQGLLADEWTMFRHDPHHSGVSAASAPTTNTTLWTAEVGYLCESSPAVWDNRVYVASYEYQTLQCFDATTGYEYWSVPLSGYVSYPSPAVYNNYVYITCVDYPFKGNIFCFNATTGEELWNASLNNNVYSSPTIADDKVYFGCQDSKIYCYHAQTGAALWNYTTAGSITATPAVADGKVYIGSTDKKMYCLNAEDGSYIWDFPSLTMISYSSATISDGKVFFGSSDKSVYCLDADTGEKIWSTKTYDSVMSSPAVYNNHVYIGSYDKNLYCLNITDGSIEWTFPTHGRIFSSPAIAKNMVFFGSRDGMIYCLDAEEGTLIWNLTTNNTIGSSPAIAQGALFITSQDGKLYAIREENQPPETPTIQGPAAAGPGVPLDFEIAAEDPDNDQILYMIDWGDGNSTDWLGPYNSSEPIIVTNTWIEKGEYTIRTKAKDASSEEESEWSDPSMISIASQLALSNIKSGFVYLRYQTFDKSYAYLYFLDTIGASIVISSDVLHIEVDASDAVKSVQYVAYNPLWDDNLTLDDNTSDDGFTQDLEIPMGLWVLTVTAYDADGRMIDVYGIDYLVFITITSGAQQLGHMNTIVKQRITNRILHR